MEEQPCSIRRRGRPSSRLIDSALAEAALAEFTERGYRAMSMESIAARAGVSKVSLYRRWNSKLAVAADVFLLLKDTSAIEDRGSFEADIRALLDANIGSSSAPFAGKILLRTMGEISEDPELLALYRTNLFAPRLEQLRSVVERARNRKELRADLPVDVACAMIAGPLFLYHLNLLAGADVALAGDPAEELTRAILGGIGR